MDVLLKKGWRIMIVWECIIKSKELDIRSIASAVARWLDSDIMQKELGLRLNKLN